MLWAGRAEEIADPVVREGSGAHFQFHQLAYAALMCLDSQQDGSISSINKVRKGALSLVRPATPRSHQHGKASEVLRHYTTCARTR